jgi:hypothetical protein
MTNYYSPVVIQQPIPKCDITALERLILSEIFTADPDDEQLYLFSEDHASDFISLDAAQLRAALDDPRAKGTVAATHILDRYSDEILGEADVDVDTSEGWWEAILQDIIRRSDTLDHLSIVTSFTCDKMRADGFGGMATLITAKTVRCASTNEMLERFMTEAADEGEIKPEPLTALQAEHAALMADLTRRQEIQGCMKRLHSLDCAIVVFTPEELGETTPIHKLESHLIEHAWPFIEAYKDETEPPAPSA